MIPTWNEAENIGPLLDAILALGPEYEALVVDDDSPDETWRLVLERSQAEPRVHLLRRSRNRGRGLAGIAGFREALRLGADLIIEMDADWSHDPKWIPQLVKPITCIPAQADVVIASRLIRGGGEEGRGWPRRMITHLANMYIRLMLRLPVRDATSGFRVFTRACLMALPWDAMQATGPEVVQEVLLAAHARGFRIVEVPFVFSERRAGESTFNKRILWHSLRAMARLRWQPGRLTSDRAVPAAAAQEDSGGLLPLPSALTIPLSWFYGLARGGHHALAVVGLRRRRRLAVPVACVGNLSVGGTGKTPFVRLLTETLQAIGQRPAILSRGYGAIERVDRPLIVSDGRAEAEASTPRAARAEQAGDEPLLLAQTCPTVPVITCSNRYRAGLAAIREFHPDVLILDDGFQHDRLRRELDIVLWDLSDLPSRQRLLPAGRLREGLAALGRAQAIVLTHGEYLGLDADKLHHRRALVVRQLKHAAPQVPIFEVETHIVGFDRVCGRLRSEKAAAAAGPGAAASPWPWAGRRVLAVSAVARPRGFEAMLKASGAQVCRHFMYPDHYIYDTWLADDWRAALMHEGAEMILTTAKDAVKLAPLPMFGLTVVAVEIAMRLTEPLRFELFLREQLSLGKKSESLKVETPKSETGHPGPDPRLSDSGLSTLRLSDLRLSTFRLSDDPRPAGL